jgi:cardiolipin synthase
MISPKLFFTVALGTLSVSCSSLVRNYRDVSAQRKEPSKTRMPAASFGSSAVRGTTLAMVRQPWGTTRLGGMVLWQRPFELIAGSLPDFDQHLARPEEAPGTAQFEALLDKKRLPAPVDGKLTWLVDGRRFFPAIEGEIRKARSSIDSQVYIFDNDDIGVRVADLLKQRSHEVPVRVVFDDLGSSVAWGEPPETPFPAGFMPPSSMAKHLREGSRVKVRSLPNPWLVCDHSKIHVFDGKVAIMGCANIGREYASEWHDLMFRVEGPAVAALQEDYHKTWRRADPAGLFGVFQKKPQAPTPPALAGCYPLRVLRTDPAAGRREIQKSMVLAIRAAHRRIWIEDPYIANDDITEALEEAAERGVDVRLIYPDRNDSKIMDIANRAFANKLVRAGGKAYAYPGMTHMKVMICDGWACVGSANLDTLSMRINRELNLAFNDRRAIDSLIAQVFRPDFAVSRPHQESKDATAPIVETIADQL